MIKTRQTCRVCGTSLIDVYDLGKIELISYHSSPISTRKIPLCLSRCDTSCETACGLVQLRHTVHPNLLYSEYFYKSGINTTMRKHLQQLVMSAIDISKVTKDSLIVDIGCNDGTTLHFFKEAGFNNLLGFDPARNLEFPEYLQYAFVQYFCNFKLFARMKKGQAKLITSFAMFYDLEDPNSFVRQIKLILERQGLWVIELSYLPSMLSQNAFDTICHEHLEYYSLSTIEYLLNNHGFEIVDVYLNSVNGGSFQIYVAHRGERYISDEAFERIQNLRKQEFELALDIDEPYKKFRNRVSQNCFKLNENLQNAKMNNKVIYAYGASTKGSTTLQSCNINKNLIKACADRNPTKWGTYIAGTGIPIVSEDEARKAHPDYMVILPWHFLYEFIEREQEYLNWGGKFIVPMPEFKIIEK